MVSCHFSASAVSWYQCSFIALAMKIVVSAFYFAGLVLLCCLILSLATTEHALCFVAYLIVPSETYTFNLIRDLIHLTFMTSSLFSGFIV